MSKITEVHAREIIDSRGNPTLEIEVTLNSGASGLAGVPSGASTGVNEALELRDGDRRRFNGKGVLKAVENVNRHLAPAVIGMEAFDQVGLDRLMCKLDGTATKQRLGANAILGVSLACAQAAAAEADLPLFRYLGGANSKVLPIPMLNIVNGGLHSDAPIAFQEFMIRPTGAPNFREALRWSSEVFHTLKDLLKNAGLNTAVGDEGGFAPVFTGGTTEALDYIIHAIERAGYRPGEEITIALDCAASSFFKNGMYDYTIFEGPDAPIRSAEEQVAYLASLQSSYPITSIEDGMDENDWTGWQLLNSQLGKQCQLVGDDLLVTNTSYLKRSIAENAANAILVKVNQIGTLTEALDAIELAKRHNYGIVVSHRSGETEDTFIADLAVAVNAGQIKTGSMSRSERIAKYNQLLRISEVLGDDAVYGWRE